MSYSVFVAGYGRTFAVRAAVRIIPSHEKWPTEADPSFRPAIYAGASRIVQPPDDRTYSAEVTAKRRNLPHHRSARAVFPYTRPIMIPPGTYFVKYFFVIDAPCAVCFHGMCSVPAGRAQNKAPGLSAFVSTPANWCLSH